MTEQDEQALLAQAGQRLSALLPEQFELLDAPIHSDVPLNPSDALWELREQNSGFGLILVEGRLSVAPRDVVRLRERLSGSVMRMMRNPVVLVVAPWLSRRTRDLLERYGFSYIDMTGNIRFRLDRPAVYIHLHGADRDPNPQRPRSPAGLQGPKARRLVRLLVDVAPPYRLTDLARAADLTQGYVSKLLDSLDDQALVERDRRGLVHGVDWPGLLQATAARYDLFRNNAASTYIAPRGSAALYQRLAGEGDRPEVVVTGSFAAADIAQVAAPTQLVLYASEPGLLRQFGRLLPTDRQADVVVLRPEDPGQLAWGRTVDGLHHVGLSQLVLDLLGGNGRLPAEGQAVMDWMREKEKRWRRPSLERLEAPEL